MRSAALCERPGVFWDLSCVPEDAGPFTKHSASRACAVDTRLSQPGAHTKDAGVGRLQRAGPRNR
ncbi:unnamed protein product [Staurois parvus]|uniref:Uncharacterized protein n=1 Tax=Staurois parvus TaxID=386267 RepID=A0ABN9B8C4_9NEOB|nr:unnamed protein product [Staurois parvus]